MNTSPPSMAVMIDVLFLLEYLQKRCGTPSAEHGHSPLGSPSLAATSSHSRSWFTPFAKAQPIPSVNATAAPSFVARLALRAAYLLGSLSLHADTSSSCCRRPDPLLDWHDGAVP